jgi:hypothetical protein
MFTAENFSPSAVTGRSQQDNKSLEIFGFSDSHTSNSNLDVSSQPSTSSLNTGRSSSESSVPHVEIKPFPKAEVLGENHRQEIRLGAVLSDAPVKVSLGAEVGALTKPIKCNRLFSDSQVHENLNNKKRIFEELTPMKGR